MCASKEQSSQCSSCPSRQCRAVSGPPRRSVSLCSAPHLGCIRDAPASVLLQALSALWPFVFGTPLEKWSHVTRTANGGAPHSCQNTAARWSQLGWALASRYAASPVAHSLPLSCVHAHSTAVTPCCKMFPNYAHNVY